MRLDGKMDCSEDVLLMFKHKLTELTEIAAKLPQDEKVAAREYFYTNLNSLHNILDDCNVNGGSTISTDTYLLKENIVNNSSPSIGTEQINPHQNIVLASQKDNACNLLNIQDAPMEQKNESICNSFTYIFELESNNDTGSSSTSSSKNETHSETIGCSDLPEVSASGENVIISPVMTNSLVKFMDKNGDKIRAIETMSETNGTIGTLSREDSRNCPIQDKGITQDMNGGTCVLQEPIQIIQGNNMSQSVTGGVTTTVNCLTDISQHIQQDSRNVTVLKEETTSDEFLILRVELEDGSVQDFKVPSHMVEEKLEKENNDDCLSPSQSQAVEDEPSESSGISQVEPTILTMNLRERPQLSFAQKQKGPGRPKNENIPEPEINSRGEPVYICEICKTSVKTYHALIVHMRTHTGSRPFCCNLCNKSFTTKGNLKAHAVTHSDDKPWKCEFCKKTFKEKKVLRTHERIHTGEKPFSCSICSRAFNQRSTLLEHILTHSNNRPHLCDMCGQGFRGASSLKAHKKRHLGTREFQCSTCNKAFVSKNELTRHTLTHTGDRPYSCQHCMKSFTRLSYLNEHLNTHTGAKPYVCIQCGEAFSESMSLTRHKRKHITSRENSDKTDFDQSVTFESADNYYTTAVSEQTVLNNGETLIQVVSEDSTKVEYFQKLRSLLISASSNDCMSNDDTSKQLYQVLCVNPYTQEVVSQSEGHQVIVEGHSDDVTTMNILSNNNMQHFTI